MVRTLHVAVIGAGAVACAHHLPGVEQAPGAEIIAVADANLDRAEAAAKKFAIPIVYQDYSELLRREEIDAVSICTPNSMHAEQALAAIAAGKHVLCEVPLATRLADCREMIAAARNRGVVLMPALTHRFHPCVRRARELLAEGHIGRPFLFRMRFAHDGPYGSWAATSDWYYDPDRAGGGVLMDLGLGALDLWIAMMGLPEWVMADTATLAKDIPMEDTALCVLEKGRVRGYVESGWHSKAPHFSVEILGSAGAVAVEYPSSVRLYMAGTGWQAAGEPGGGAAERQMAHFVECCLEGKEPAVTMEDGMQSVRLVLAAYEAARSRTRVTV